MDFLDPWGIALGLHGSAPAGAEPLSVMLINGQKLGLFQKMFGRGTKKCAGPKTRPPLSSEFRCGPTAALARTDASIALQTTSGSPGRRLAGMCVRYPRVVCSTVPIGST